MNGECFLWRKGEMPTQELQVQSVLCALRFPRSCRSGLPGSRTSSQAPQATLSRSRVSARKVSSWQLSTQSGAFPNSAEEHASMTVVIQSWGRVLLSLVRCRE